MSAIVNVIVSGPVGAGKSAIVQEIVGALRAIGLTAEAVRQTPYDTSGDPIASLDLYRDGLRVQVHEEIVTERAIEERVGGTYQMPDGRTFWIDGPVAREIASRVSGRSPSSNEKLRP